MNNKQYQKQKMIVGARETFSHYISGNQTAAANKHYWLVPEACEIVDIRAYANTAPVGSAMILDVNKNGTTLFTDQDDRPTIAAGENESTTTNPAVTTLAAGDRLSFDVDQIGSGTAGAGLTISIEVTRKVL